MPEGTAAGSSRGGTGYRRKVSFPSCPAVFNPFQAWLLWEVASGWQAALAAGGVWGQGRGEAKTSFFLCWYAGNQPGTGILCGRTQVGG